MYKAFSELSLNSLIVAKTDRIRQEKTKRKLEKMAKGDNVITFSLW